MAWSGSADVPAARVAVAVNDLIQARDGAARLRTFLLQLDDDQRAAAWARMEIDGVLTKLSSAMSALDVSDAVGRSAAAGSDGARPQQSGSFNKRKQSSSSSRSQRPSDKTITDTLDDGHVRRQYGQKEVQDSPHPRSCSADVPAESFAVAVNEARDGAARLRTFLLQLDDDQRAAWALLEIDGVLSRLTKLSSATSALDMSDAVVSDGARPQHKSGSSCGNKMKQQSSSRRSQITDTLEDGHVWRKYGQKKIQDSPHLRSYYRCTHKSDQGCHAKRQVQRCDTDTSKYVVTYYGQHTCQDPSTIPIIIDHGALAELDQPNNLISFGSGGGRPAPPSLPLAELVNFDT